MSKVTNLTGVDMSYAKKSMKDVIRFEIGLAKVKYVDCKKLLKFMRKLT
jgi:hypothetical protein